MGHLRPRWSDRAAAARRPPRHELDLSLKHAHFWAMDEWVSTVARSHLASAHRSHRTNMELCFDGYGAILKMPGAHALSDVPAGGIHEQLRSGAAAVLQGGQGEVSNWAFNAPLPRGGPLKDAPPSPADYLALPPGCVRCIHSPSCDARTSGSGNLSIVPPTRSVSVPSRRGKRTRSIIWHSGTHDNPFGDAPHDADDFEERR